MAQIKSDHGNFISAATEYEILRGIAEGSSGQVFLCKNMLDQHEYALKKIFIEEDDDEEKKSLRRRRLGLWLAWITHTTIRFGEVITVTILRNLLGNLIVRVMTQVGREILPGLAFIF